MRDGQVSDIDEKKKDLRRQSKPEEIAKSKYAVED